MQAVILAAGQGQRIREHHTKPKGFIEIAGKPIIVRSLEILRDYGIKKIVLIIGYACDYYEELSKKTGYFETVFNPHYARYNSHYSLYQSKDWVTDDILLLESDIIYEPRAIAALLGAPEKDAILVSGKTNSGDEVYVEVHDEHLVNMSKRRELLNQSHLIGEFVGITKLSYATYQKLIALSEQDEPLLKHGCYDEQGFVALTHVCPIACVKIEDLLWSEIDQLDQWHHAKNIHEQMLKKERALVK